MCQAPAGPPLSSFGQGQVRAAGTSSCHRAGIQDFWGRCNQSHVLPNSVEFSRVAGQAHGPRF